MSVAASTQDSQQEGRPNHVPGWADPSMLLAEDWENESTSRPSCRRPSRNPCSSCRCSCRCLCQNPWMRHCPPCQPRCQRLPCRRWPPWLRCRTTLSRYRSPWPWNRRSCRRHPCLRRLLPYLYRPSCRIRHQSQPSCPYRRSRSLPSRHWRYWRRP